MAEVSGPPWPSTAQRLGLGDIEFDLRYRTVLRDGVSHEVNPRCFDLLLLFLREPHVLHTREEILLKVWTGVVVEDANITSCVWTLRRVLGGTAKHWIRTVSKKGYAFDPPPALSVTVRPSAPTSQTEPDAPPVAIAAAEETTPSDRYDTALPPAPVVRTVTASRLKRRMAIGLVVSLVVLGVLGVLFRGGLPVAGPTRVVLAPSADSPLAGAAGWGQLLHSWTDWQLRSMPGLAVTRPTDVRAGSDMVVLLSVDMTARGDDEWLVSARFRGPAAPVDIVRRCPTPELVAVVGEVSREVVGVLAPAVAAAELPQLALDTAAATQLVEGLAAEQRRHWGDAARLYTEVLRKAPTFGFARMRLALSLAELGQHGAAKAEMAQAQGWIQSLPVTLRQPLQAQERMVQQDYLGAASAFAALQERGGGENTAYRLAQASALRRAGRSRDAAARLAGELPLAPTEAVGWLIARAETELANRDLARAAQTATEAMTLARKLGWEHERAQAALVLAEAQARSGERVDDAVYEQAAQGFSSAGDRLGALRARAYAQLRYSAGDEPGSDLNQLLAEARTAGNVTVEIDALRRAAAFHYRAGNTRATRDRLAQAAAVAELAGDLQERRLIDMDLLGEDTFSLDFAALDQRIAKLRTEPMQGGMAYTVGVNAVRLHYLRGQYADALTTLQNTEAAMRETATGTMSQIAAGLGCLRAGVHIAQGETALARNDLRDCRKPGLPRYNEFADIGDADLAIRTGDLDAARRLLVPLRETLAAQKEEPLRWNLIVEIGPLLARTGELDTAEQLVNEVLPAVTRSGNHLITAALQVTRAEIALARGRIDAADADAQATDAIMPADYWSERRRLRTVQALILRARGQTDAAAKGLESLHRDTLEHSDVLAELLVHSLMDTSTLAKACPGERHRQLLAQSGMRGASDRWMNPPPIAPTVAR